MSPELALLVERYLKGDTQPLITNMIQSPEAALALRTGEAIAKRLETGLSPAMSVQSFDGQFVAIGCGRHPPMHIPVTNIRVRVPTDETLTETTMKDAYCLPSKLPKLFCKDCLQERQQESLVQYGQRTVVCTRHQNTLLDERGVCEKCETQKPNKALNGESIRFVSADKTLSHYTCPMHGDFSRGHRAKPACPTCHSVDGIAHYAQSVGYGNNEELLRLKSLLAALSIKPPKDMEPHKRKMLRDFIARLLDPANNMHLLHIFPTEAFIKGDWLREHQSMPSTSKGRMEYLMPSAQARVLPEVALLEKADVFWGENYSTAHYHMHLEATR